MAKGRALKILDMDSSLREVSNITAENNTTLTTIPNEDYLFAFNTMLIVLSCLGNFYIIIFDAL